MANVRQNFVKNCKGCRFLVLGSFARGKMHALKKNLSEIHV